MSDKTDNLTHIGAEATEARNPSQLKAEAAALLREVEADSYEIYFRAAFQNIVDFAAGAPKNVLNPGAA